MSAISQELLPCIRQQNKIGWSQLYRGRVARGMIQFMEGHYRQLQIDTKRYTGEKWGKMLLKNIWNMVLKLWENRNEIVHGVSDDHRTEQERLHHRVHKYYDMKGMLDVTDREKIFYKDLEIMLQEDTRYIKAWLKLAQRALAVAKKEQAKPRNERRMMEQYFAWKPPITSRIRNQKAPRAPDETHPD
jgi:hypothetical protein